MLKARKALGLCAVTSMLLASVGAHAQSVSLQSAAPQHQKYSFADLSWGSSRAVVRSALEAKGYEFVKQDNDGDLNFKGNLLGHQSLIIALMGGDSLVKVFVVIATPDNKAREFYRDMKETLTNKYVTVARPDDFLNGQMRNVRPANDDGAPHEQTAVVGLTERVRAEVAPYDARQLSDYYASQPVAAHRR